MQGLPKIKNEFRMRRTKTFIGECPLPPPTRLGLHGRFGEHHAIISLAVV